MYSPRLEDLLWKNLLSSITPAEECEMKALADASLENRDLFDQLTSDRFKRTLEDLRTIDFRILDQKMKDRFGNDYPFQ